MVRLPDSSTSGADNPYPRGGGQLKNVIGRPISRFVRSFFPWGSWTDEKEFYRRITFRDQQDLVRKLREWKREYDHHRLYLALDGKMPAERLCERRVRTLQGVREST